MAATDSRTLERMQCMEIWGGNRAIDKSFQAPGLDIYVHSAPYQASGTGGGDLYYLTSCASGRISRILLADVCGHGMAVSPIAVALRDLLRQNVNTISQEQFVRDMNNEFGNLGEESGFATAIVVTYFAPKKSLALNMAGHPPPFYFRAARRQWVPLDAANLDRGFSNLPLGIVEDSQYPGRELETSTGDMLLLYSDAFIESEDASGNIIGPTGLLELLNEIGSHEPEDVIPLLRKRIQDLSANNLLEDDASLILVRFTRTKVRLRDNLYAPLRLISSVRDKTAFRRHEE